MANNFFLIPLDEDGAQIGEELYELHATSAIKVSYKSKLSDKPSESGGAKVNNLVIDPTTITFTGVLSDVKKGGNLSVKHLIDSARGDEDIYYTIGEYINKLVFYQKAGVRFLVEFSGDTNVENEIEWLENVILTDLTIDKSAKYGKSWKVNVTLQEEAAISFIAGSGSSESNEGTQSPDDEQKCKVYRGNFNTVYIKNGGQATLTKPKGC